MTDFPRGCKLPVKWTCIWIDSDDLSVDVNARARACQNWFLLLGHIRTIAVTSGSWSPNSNVRRCECAWNLHMHIRTTSPHCMRIVLYWIRDLVPWYCLPVKRRKHIPTVSDLVSGISRIWKLARGRANAYTCSKQDIVFYWL